MIKYSTKGHNPSTQEVHQGIHLIRMLSASCQKANLSASLYISITKAFSCLDVIQKIISYAFHGTHSIVAGLFLVTVLQGQLPS